MWPSPSQVSYLWGNRASVLSCRSGQYQFSSWNASGPMSQRSGRVATSSMWRGASRLAGTFIARSLMPEVTSTWNGRAGAGLTQCTSRWTASEISSWNTDSIGPR